MTGFKISLSKKAGFTLFEMLIAIFIFAIMSSFLYFTFVTSENGTRLALNSSKPYIESHAVFNIIHHKLLEFNYVYPVFFGKEKLTGGKSFSNLYFSGFSHTPVPFNGKSSRENLNYFYVAAAKTNNKKTHELVYMESYFKSVNGNITPRFKKIIIARNIVFFSVKYLIPNQANQNLWLADFDYFKYNMPPSAIKISLGLLNNGHVKKFTYRFNM